MHRYILVAATLFAALLIGYFVGRSSVPTTDQDYSLYIADVTLIDGETGVPVNTELQFPDGFFSTFQLSESASRKISGTGRGIIRTEQDAETGRRRIIWIGASDATFVFRFSADGYESVDLPPQSVVEVDCCQAVGGVAGSSTVTMTRTKNESEGRVDASSQSLSD